MAAKNESLHGAVECLNQCILLCAIDGDNANQNQIRELIESSRVLLAYVWLELNEPNQVIHLADLTAKDDPLPCRSGKGQCVFSLRRQATMRMYACEACSMLGIPSGDLALLYDNDAEFNAVMKGKDSVATDLSAIDLTNKHRQSVDSEVKKLHNATASLQISSAMSKLSLNDVDNALELTHYVCRKLTSEAESNDLKHDAFSSLIQSLVCGGRIAEAVQLAKSLK